MLNNCLGIWKREKGSIRFRSKLWLFSPLFFGFFVLRMANDKWFPVCSCERIIKIEGTSDGRTGRRAGTIKLCVCVMIVLMEASRALVNRRQTLFLLLFFAAAKLKRTRVGKVIKLSVIRERREWSLWLARSLWLDPMEPSQAIPFQFNDKWSSSSHQNTAQRASQRERAR